MKTNREDLDGATLNIAKAMNKMLLNQNYQRDLAKYAWEQARIFGCRGTLKQFLSALNLGHILLQGSGVIDKAKSRGISELTEGGIAGGSYRVDYKKV